MFKIATGDSEGRATHWFASFLAETITNGPPDETLQQSLDRYAAKASTAEFMNIGDPLIFESEDDYLLFVLKWA